MIISTSTRRYMSDREAGRPPALLGSRPTGYHAAFRDFPIAPTFAAWLKRSSSSPARTAAIGASMSAGSLSFEPTTMPALPFSNSTGFAPNLTAAWHRVPYIPLGLGS
jgi:hypothetical protein